MRPSRNATKTLADLAAKAQDQLAKVQVAPSRGLFGKKSAEDQQGKLARHAKAQLDSHWKKNARRLPPSAMPRSRN